METRSRTRIRATNSPPREVTEGGTQPVRDVFVDPPSSAIGLSGDGKFLPDLPPQRLVPAAPASQPSVVRVQENREFVDTVCSDVVRISTPDERQNSTLVP